MFVLVLRLIYLVHLHTFLLYFFENLSNTIVPTIVRIKVDDIKKYILENNILESTQSEDLHEEIGLALKEFGNIRNGFKMTPIDDIKELIRPAGFYNVKAGRIQEVSQILIDQYGGEVPDTVEEMVKLPGVGRKTANCVMVFAFELPAIPVDTHVHRISNRMGLVNTKTPDDTEMELSKIAPKELWIKLNDLMVQFGQNICKPIGPQCEICPCTEICDYYEENV